MAELENSSQLYYFVHKFLLEFFCFVIYLVFTHSTHCSCNVLNVRFLKDPFRCLVYFPISDFHLRVGLV